MNLDNHPKRGILKDIDMNTLMRMRTEEGMSNREIAEKVGVTYEAIHRIIGKQPKGIRYSAKATRGGENIEANVSSVAKPPALPVKSFECSGEVVSFEVNGDLVIAKSDKGEILLRKGELPMLVRDLMRLDETIKAIGVQTDEGNKTCSQAGNGTQTDQEADCGN